MTSTHHLKDTDADLTSIIRQHQAMVFGLALSMLGDFGAAEDTAQETFVVFFQQAGALRDPEALPAYLRGIARNLCRRELRRRRHEQNLLNRPVAPPQQAPDAESLLGHQRSRRAVLDAVATLPRLQRDAVILYYLHGCAHKQVASFLSLSPSKVNNLLHAARTRLKGRTIEMIKKTLNDHTLPEDFVEAIGRIIKVQGHLVEARFEGARRPDYDEQLLLTDDEGNPSAEMTVIQRLPDGRLRCLVTHTEGTITPGGRITPTISATRPQVEEAALLSILDEVTPRTRTEPEFVETGIKSIDLFCPLTKGARIALTGPMGAGRLALITELCQRLDGHLTAPDRLSLFTFIGLAEAEMIHNFRKLEDEPIFTDYNDGVTDCLHTFYLPSKRGGDPTLGAAEAFDTRICLDMVRGVKHLWPAIDPHHSRARHLTEALVGPEHVAIAREARALIAEAQALMVDPTFLRLVSNDAFEAARHRLRNADPDMLARLSAPERLTVDRARRLEAFLTTPFFCAEDFTGKPGQHVPLTETLGICRDILDGELDHLDPEDLHFIGGRDTLPV